MESEKPDEDMRHVQQRWYITPRGITLEEIPFLGPDGIPTKRKQFCLKSGTMRDADNQKLEKDLICRALGIGAAESPLGKKFCAVRFFRMAYTSRLNADYLHHGDLDPYGFLILENLKQKTGIPMLRAYREIFDFMQKYNCKVEQESFAAMKL